MMIYCSALATAFPDIGRRKFKQRNRTRMTKKMMKNKQTNKNKTKQNKKPKQNKTKQKPFW